MKKVILLALGIGMLISCNSNKISPLELVDYNDSRDIPLYDTTSYPSATLSWALKIPESSSKKDIDSFVNNSLFNIVCDDSCNCSSIEEAINYYAENYKENLRIENMSLEEENDELKGRILELVGVSFEEFNMDVLYNKNGLFSFTIVKNSYSGGAHGMTNETGYILDLKSKTILYYNDIFKEIDSLQQILLDYLMKAHNVSQYDDMYELGFFNSLEFFVSENIALTKEGIVWIYNPYEIAPYAMGIIKILIPYKALEHYIEKDSPILKLAK